MRVRTFGLFVAVAALFWFQFVNARPAIEIWQSGLDRFDSRPARSILIIGNSRTYLHDMPHMVRLIADSERVPQKYQITTRTLPGVSFKDLWDDPVTQRLLSQTWDDIILQGESRAEGSEDNRNAFLTYGQQLMTLAQVHGKTALIVNWAYGEAIWKGYPAEMRVTQYEDLQRDHASLARSTNAQLINVGQVWEDALSELPAVPLYEDGNHPTVAGSYLSALMVYAHLSRRRFSAASYVPSGISADQAMSIRRLVDNKSSPAGESD